MFYLLHRLVKWFCILLLLGCIAWLYTQRQALEPLWVWYDVYENGGIQKTEPLPTLEGEGTAVLNGHTFQMKSGGKMYIVRLTGFEVPAEALSLSDLQVEKARRDFLRRVVVMHPVRVQVTYSNLNNLLGVVYVGSTNLNTYYVANGLGSFNREYVKSTPRDLQYKFFAAERAHRIDRTMLAEQANHQ